MKRILFSATAIAVALGSADAFAATATVGADVDESCSVTANSTGNTLPIGGGTVRVADPEITCNDYNGVQLRLATQQGGLQHESGEVEYQATWAHTGLPSNNGSVTLDTTGKGAGGSQVGDTIGEDGELADAGGDTGTLDVTNPALAYSGGYSDTLQLDIEVQ